MKKCSICPLQKGQTEHFLQSFTFWSLSHFGIKYDRKLQRFIKPLAYIIDKRKQEGSDDYIQSCHIMCI